jgi:hypothetical protein
LEGGVDVTGEAEKTRGNWADFIDTLATFDPPSLRTAQALLRLGPDARALQQARADDAASDSVGETRPQPAVP